MNVNGGGLFHSIHFSPDTVLQGKTSAYCHFQGIFITFLVLYLVSSL